MKVFVILSVLVALASAEAPVYRQQNQQRRYYFARQEAAPAAPAAPADPAPYSASGWKPDGPAFELPERQVEDSYGPPRNPAKVDQQYGAPEEISQQQRFQFRARQQQQQQQQFSASQNQYLAPVAQPQGNQYGVPEPQEQFQPPQPDREYGAPTTTTEEPNATTETEDATTTVAPQTDSEVEPVNSVNELDEEGDLDEQQAEQQIPAQRGEYYVALPDGRLQRIRYVSHEDVEAMKYFARIRAENVEPIRGPIYSYAPLQEVQFASGNLQLAPTPAVSAYPAAKAPPASPASGKLELQEEIAPRVPLAAVLQYSYDNPSPVVPIGAPAYGPANYRNQAPEQRYLLSF